MATKVDFTADEWKKILTSPVLAALTVTVADPSSLWGLPQEGFASGRALIEAKNAPEANDLVKPLVDELITLEGRAIARDGVKAELSPKSPSQIKQQALSTLAEIGAISTPRRRGTRPRAAFWALAASRSATPKKPPSAKSPPRSSWGERLDVENWRLAQLRNPGASWPVRATYSL